MAEIEKIELVEGSTTEEAAKTDAPGEGIAEALTKEKAASPKKFKINFDFLKSKKFQKWALIILGVILIVFVLPLTNVLFRARAVGKSADLLIESAKSQDIILIKDELTRTKKSLGKLKGSLVFIGWTKYIPFFGGYTRDVGHVVNAGTYGLEAAEIFVGAIEPYADIIGLTGSAVLGAETEGGEKTTQERLDFVANIVPQLIPKIDEIAAKMALVGDEINQINPNRYPVRIGEREVRSRIVDSIAFVDQFSSFLVDGKELIASAPYLLGLDTPRTYLVLFQNDKELRPTGGFMTGYSIMKVDRGRFEPVSSNDLYNLDDAYKPTIKAPKPIIDHIKGPYILSNKLRLRDMNWDPDFEASMALFTEEAGKAGIEEIDGVIAVDTHLVVNLLTALGPIGVPEYGEFSVEPVDECRCPQVIHELESFADIEGPVVWDPAGTGKIVYAPPNYENRKKIIGPLMNSIVANAMGQPKDKLPGLFNAVFKSLFEKHILFFLNDETSQVAVESFGIAGKVKEYDGDYLMIVDANLGGRKSNLYTSQEVEQKYEMGKDGTVEKTLIITYKNPEKHDGWLNSVLPNWVRVYVPQGSKLIASEGLQEEEEPYEENGKTVFAGFFELRPEGVSRVTLKYSLPEKVEGDLNLLIQKQPGLGGPLYTTITPKDETETYLLKDTEFKVRL